MTKSEYTERIHDFLQKMKVGTIEELDFLPNKIMPSKIAKAFFVDIVKDFISRDEGRENGFYIEFNSGFEKIRKVAYFKSRQAPEPELRQEQGSVAVGSENQSGGKILTESIPAV